MALHYFVGIHDFFHDLPTDANRLQDPSRLTSPTPHGVIGSQSGHNSANGPNQNIHDLACPAGVEPATYGLEGLKNLQRQCRTMIYSG